MPRHSPRAIDLTPEQRRELDSRTQGDMSPYRDVIGAPLILLAADALPNDVIAARLDTPRQIVSKWRKRFFEERLPGLDEEPRGGLPAHASPPWPRDCPGATRATNRLQFSQPTPLPHSINEEANSLMLPLALIASPALDFTPSAVHSNVCTANSAVVGLAGHGISLMDWTEKLF